ncbi:FGGY family carbohydrate kinase [Pontibacter sp. G13]|uniref:xylulokinase n=1 Tax=Pontibacter sp. G13 TaxID=3074898 RepID=UPI002889599A|nr:FGGY family carbohydrate kinase [Pontibacter sp. G13]WNJ20178.1 FGGY family carbohydrate kinase [Pontibacter sp. G13]
MLLLGYDIGSSSVKAALVDGHSGKTLASTFYPKSELEISAPHQGWAEQSPETWWSCIQAATQELLANPDIDASAIGAIGISYQMHGLVVVDKAGEVIRPSIIWCDSRAVEIGEQAFQEMGEAHCLSHFLNSPGNFTASKLKWVKENEPEQYARIHKMMLPGDYIAYQLTGEIRTTISGLSEGILWDFEEDTPAKALLAHYGIEESLLPEIVPTFGEQGRVSADAAQLLGIPAGIPVSYRAGDQPNNAFSLNVLNPGEIAATAGTSGVVYGVSGTVKYDAQSRVNSFAHVNHGEETRLGVLLCINGTGILNNWLRKNVGGGIDYVGMNQAAEQVAIGSDGLVVLPFGNGAERVLGNRDFGSQVNGLDFNRHGQGHLFRAAQEGIVYAFHYGMDIMEQMGIKPAVIRAGQANMFLSPIFRQTLADVTQVPIELYDTDGAVGAARGAGVGAGFYPSPASAFERLELLERIEPQTVHQAAQQDAYERWQTCLENYLT